MDLKPKLCQEILINSHQLCVTRAVTLFGGKHEYLQRQQQAGLLEHVGRDDVRGEEEEAGAVVLGVADDVLQAGRQAAIHHVADAVAERRVLLSLNAGSCRGGTTFFTWTMLCVYTVHCCTVCLKNCTGSGNFKAKAFVISN